MEKVRSRRMTNVFYPEAIQLFDTAVLARFYAEGVVTAGGIITDRITMTWVKEMAIG